MGIVAFALLGASSAPTYAVDGVADEFVVKAAVVLNVARFTDWPARSFASDSSPLVLCMLGTDPLTRALGELDGKSVKGRELKVQQMAAPRLRNCHIFYVSPQEQSDLKGVLRTAEELSVLTISDAERFARQGGMVALFNEGSRIRFEINLRSAERAGLKFSSQLLKLAAIVREQ